MYYYAVVFFSTMFLTIIITKRFCPSKKIKEKPKEAALFHFTPMRNHINPSNIPILSQEKHDEYMRMSNQSTNSLVPQSKDIYSATLRSEKCLFIRKAMCVGEWTAFERENTDAPIGSWFPIRETSLFNKEDVRVLFAILRVDRPEKWEHYTYFYRKDEKVPRMEISILSNESTKKASIQEHDDAISKHYFPERKYIYSTSVLPISLGPSYVVKPEDDWFYFERKHANAPIGSWIHFEDADVYGSFTFRVTFAILRVNRPERWEEHVYLYNQGDHLPKE